MIVAGAAVAKPKAPKAIVVKSGETLVVDHTIATGALIVEDGGAIAAVDADHGVTLTVNGAETGQELATWEGVDTVFVAPAAHCGNVVLTLTDATLVPYAMGGGPPGSPPPEPMYFPFRQALHVNESGEVEAKSVFAAIMPGKPIKKHGKARACNDKVTDTAARNIMVKSTGECFDGAHIRNKGVVRSAVIADKGANVVAKNPHIQVKNGVLPDDYVGTIDTTQMRSVRWMLRLSGNNRATNLLGTNTKASYIRSYIGAEGWGVLSTDGCTTPQLTAIDSTIAITGKDGHGSYGTGNATERLLGCTFNVATYATISRGGFLYYGDSTRSTVSALNDSIGMGLTMQELRSLPVKRTVVNSDRFGIMWHGGGTLDVNSGTQFNTKEATFLDKGHAIAITVDGSQGAKLNPKNGVLFQLMDDDDPDPSVPSGATDKTYYDPNYPDVAPADPDATHDLTVADDSDAPATFTKICLKGDFYNWTRGGIVQGPFGPPSSASTNMGLTFVDVSIAGVIMASTALHPVGAIDSTNYQYLGEVTNTPAPAVNNGVVVALSGHSTWTVTGASYLTSLTVGAGATIAAPMGHTVSMTVNGADMSIVPGHPTYTGSIVLTVN